jgi:DNA-binding NtrC family response regulator
VVSASSGEEGVAYFKDLLGRVQLVLLDLIMPGIGGEAAFDAMREIDASVPVLLTSGYARGDVSERLMQQGARGMLHKPCRSETLLVAVRNVLDGKPAQDRDA